MNVKRFEGCTPGPWTYEGGEAMDAQGNIVAMAYREPIRRDGKTANGIAPWERDRNIELAAAAPRLLRERGEMIEALRGILDWYAGLATPGDVPDSLIVAQRLREARAILARIEAD